MSSPVSRRRLPERLRPAWPAEFWDQVEMSNLWDRMGRMFEALPGVGPEAWVPAVETEEAPDAYLVRAELPGMKSDDVNVELNGAELRITGEIEESDGGSGKTRTLRQRHGRFAYRTTLPSDADADNADAELADGVLTVRLPKAAQARSRRIAIKR
jgi:HSP20 family protein